MFRPDVRCEAPARRSLHGRRTHARAGYVRGPATARHSMSPEGNERLRKHRARGSLQHEQPPVFGLDNKTELRLFAAPSFFAEVLGHSPSRYGREQIHPRAESAHFSTNGHIEQ